MSRVIPLAFALLWLSSSQAGVPPPPITGTQVSIGYSNLASGQLLKASEQVSSALTQAGFIPTESFTGAMVSLEGQSVHASGRVRGTICDYSFRNGALNGIHRADLFEDKGPASLILHHLTNEVLSLPTSEAPARALKLLRCLSYDADTIRNAYRITARDDLMDAYPIRNGGPAFPKDLHFFGELISRKKIRIYVEFAPQNPASLTNQWESANMRLEFLATTGELLDARLPDPSPLTAIGIRSPGRLPVVEASDFTPPIFITASRKLAASTVTVSPNDAVALLRQAWADLKPKLGSNPVQCYLLCDNLNQPETVAREFSTLAQATPWAGASHFWPDDLPFARATMNSLSQDRRGVAFLAICGKVHTQLEAIRNLDDVPAPRDGDKEGQARFANDRERLLPLITNLLTRIAPPASMPDTALFMIQASPNLASRVVSGEIESRTHTWAQVFEASGARPYNTIGEGLTYYNGAVLTNTLVVLRLSGSLPLRMDPASLLRRLPERRLISGEVSRPVTDLAYSFGPHPMQELFGLLGRDLIALLQQADSVEPFRIKPNMYGEQSVPGRPNIEGHEIITEGKPLGPDFAGQVAAAILNDKNVLGVGANCDFMPRDAFRISHGNEFAILLISFECREIHLKYYDATGKLAREAGFYMGANADALARLVKEATGTSAVAAHLSLPSDFLEPASVDGLVINSNASSIVLTWPSRSPESFAVLWRSNATIEAMANAHKPPPGLASCRHHQLPPCIRPLSVPFQQSDQLLPRIRCS
jgi:hypothetical protein